MCARKTKHWDKAADEVTKVSLSSTGPCGDDKQAQMHCDIEMSDAMECAAEDDDPDWLALLGSWLQAYGNQRLIHVLNRSVPVEKNEEWMVFFCKRGKQKHNRSGFYWGAPTKTSSGYD